MPTLSAHQCRLDSIAQSTGQCNSCKDAQTIGPTMARDLIQEMNPRICTAKKLIIRVAARSCCKKLLQDVADHKQNCFV